jgi:hypothetical protein
MNVAVVVRMATTPRVSGLDLARGLVRSGHRVTGKIGGYVLLEKGSRAVTIPLQHEEMHPGLLHFLLLAAGVSLSDLLAALRPTSSVPPPLNCRPPSKPEGPARSFQRSA